MSPRTSPNTGTTRRDFLKLGGSALVLFGHRPGSLFAGPAAARSVLVVVFQRGAADALHLVAPYRDPRYRELRGAIALEEPGRGERPTLDLGDGFAFHPALTPLYPMYREGKLAVVMNVGSPDPTRSHFDAQDYLESGTPGKKSTRDGWLARALAAVGMPDRSPFTSVSLTSQMPRTLAGARDTMALEDFRKLEAPPRMEGFLARVERAYARDTSPVFRDAGVQAFRALEMFRKSDPFRGESGGRSRRPRRGGPGVLRQLATLLKADLGIRAAFVESGGWDTHFAQGGATGQMANLMGGLASSLVSFFDDVGSKLAVTLLVVTEFGRTARINGAGGTDHGHGAALLAMGAGVQGGRVHGDWLGLKTKHLYDGRDLPVTTDFRDVFDEAARHAFALDRSVDLFPGYRPRGVGVMGPSPSSPSASIWAASSAKRAR